MLKYCALFSLCAGLGLAGSFITGQGARVVIGQTTFTSQSPGASSTNFGSVGGLAFAGNTLYVTDANRLGLLQTLVREFSSIADFSEIVTEGK